MCTISKWMTFMYDSTCCFTNKHCQVRLPSSNRGGCYISEIRSGTADRSFDVGVSSGDRKEVLVLCGPRMTRSHVLLHCRAYRLRIAREEAWEGKEPGSIRVLLGNPRWERRLLGFLEMSRVGTVMDDGTDEDQERVERMDQWIAWEVEERMEAQGDG